MKCRIFLLVPILLAMTGCHYEYLDRNDQLDEQLRAQIISVSETNTLDHFILPSEDNLAAIPQDPKNPLNHAKVQLGQYLFFETGLARNPRKMESFQSWSCSTCHIPERGFRPGIKQGIADGGIGFGDLGTGRRVREGYDGQSIDAQGIRPLTVLNVAMYTNTQWAGQFGGNFLNEDTEHLWKEEDRSDVNALGYYGLESQNIEGIDLHRMKMSLEISQELGYKDLFDQAFPELPVERRYTDTTTAFALSAYIRSLLTTEAPFQLWLKGDESAMTNKQKEGALVFFNKGGCYKCHKNANLGANEFHAIGVLNLNQNGGIPVTDDHIKNLGRGFFTEDPADNYKFKVPQLYNLKDAIPYFHGGSAQTLDEVIDYFDKAVPENPIVPEKNISPSFRPLGLTDEEKENLKTFLVEALHDPSIHRYVPPYLQSGYCFPNNDSLSRVHMGCD